VKAKIQDNEAISSNFVDTMAPGSAKGTACFSQVAQNCLKTHHGPVCGDCWAVSTDDERTAAKERYNAWAEANEEQCLCQQPYCWEYIQWKSQKANNLSCRHFLQHGKCQAPAKPSSCIVRRHDGNAVAPTQLVLKEDQPVTPPSAHGSPSNQIVIRCLRELKRKMVETIDDALNELRSGEAASGSNAAAKKRPRDRDTF